MERILLWIDGALQWPLLEWAWGLVNSNFAAALAGALAGALAAQRIADRSKQREELLLEIRSTNSAIMLSFSVVNAGLALKNQYVRDIHATYTAKKKELEAILSARAVSGVTPTEPFEFQADFRSLQMPLVPIELLRTLVIEDVSVGGRALTAAISLAGAAESLAETIAKRNSLIERYRALGPKGEAQLPAFYFGLPYGPGHVSMEYPDTIEAIHRLTDDIIFFADILAADLGEHGQSLLATYGKIAKIKKEKIVTLDFSDAREEGLLPDPKDYADWLKGFRKSVPLESSKSLGSGGNRESA